MSDKRSILAVFAYLDELVAALKVLRAKGVRIDSVYSPVPRHEIREALGLGELTTVRFFTLTGAILGIVTGVFLTVYTSIQWNFIVGGKPVIPIIPSVIPAFEFLILFAVFFNLGGMLYRNRLPRLRLPDHFDPRFTQDQFGVLIYCTEAEREEIGAILRKSGAEEIHEPAK